LATDRAAAQAMLAEYVRKAEREKVGLINPTDKHLQTPLAKHLTDYQKHLEAKGNAERYIFIAVSRLKAMLTSCHFLRIGDISPFTLANWLRNQREENKFGIATSNDYLVAIKAFCNWLVSDRRMLQNPLTHLRRLNAETDIRHQRRVLRPDELERLITTIAKSKIPYCGLTGKQRSMLYRVAAFTGLRAQELASLTPHSFNLETSPPTVTVAACYSKHRRRDVLPLATDLAAALRIYLSDQQSHERLWDGNWYHKGSSIIRRDLAATRKVWIEELRPGKMRNERVASDYLCAKDRNGHVVDFHSLRHGFITYLVTANVPPKVAQTLARHSTITLTMDRYTHLGVNDLVDGLKQLPTMAGKK
jgi:integrase